MTIRVKLHSYEELTTFSATGRHGLAMSRKDTGNVAPGLRRHKLTSVLQTRVMSGRGDEPRRPRRGMRPWASPPPPRGGGGPLRVWVCVQMGVCATGSSAGRRPCCCGGGKGCAPAGAPAGSFAGRARCGQHPSTPAARTALADPEDPCPPQPPSPAGSMDARWPVTRLTREAQQAWVRGRGGGLRRG